MIGSVSAYSSVQTFSLTTTTSNYHFQQLWHLGACQFPIPISRFLMTTLKAYQLTIDGGIFSGRFSLPFSIHGNDRLSPSTSGCKSITVWTQSYVLPWTRGLDWTTRLPFLLRLTSPCAPCRARARSLSLMFSPISPFFLSTSTNHGDVRCCSSCEYPSSAPCDACCSKSSTSPR